jgi:peptide/nickel transport system permease protein
VSVARTVLSRGARFVATLLIVTFLTSIMLSFVRGSPAALIAGPGATPNQIQLINHQYHFDQGPVTRYIDWLKGAVRGDLGRSYQSKQPVWETIKERLPVTLELAILAMLLALVIAVPLAIWSAQRPDSGFDRTVSFLSYAQLSIPNFAVALILVYLFAYRFKIFPVLGWVPLTKDPWDNLKHAVLPVVTIALAQVVILQRVLRAELIQTLQEDYIALARSKGLSRRAIMWKHALKPSSFSLLTLVALSFGALIGGTVIVEQVFTLPGLGSLIIDSITSKDLVVVEGVVAVIAITFVALNLIVDLLYAVLDPRVRGKA